MMLKQIVIALSFFAFAIDAKVTLNDLTAANQALTAAINEDNRCASASDCAVVATGARACGGPNGYVAYSINSYNADLIRSLALKTTKLEQQFNAENSIFSICSLVLQPGVKCDESNKCATAPRSSSFGDFSLS